MSSSSILKPFYAFFDPFFVKNKKRLKEILLIEPTKLIITPTLKTNNLLNLNWLFSKRLNLILTKNKLHLGEIIIDKDAISDPELVYYSSYFGLLKYQILKFRFNNKIFLLGTGMNPKWRTILKIENETKIENKNNIILLLISVFAICMVGYSIYKSFIY